MLEESRKTPSNITVEIIDGEAGRQIDNLIGNSALRSTSKRPMKVRILTNHKL